MDTIVMQAGEGKVIPRPTTHGSVTLKVANGASTVFDTERSAGDADGPGLHAHPGFDETFYIVSGEWEFVAGDRTFVSGPGTVVHLPRGVFHTFRSTGRLDGKLLGIAVPGGIEDFFEESTAHSGGRTRRTAARDRVRLLVPDRSVPIRRAEATRMEPVTPMRTVREGGFEPPRPCGHRILSPARLPGSATLARAPAYPQALPEP